MRFELSSMDESFIYIQASALGTSKEPRILTIRLEENCEDGKVCKEDIQDKKQTQTEEGRITPIDVPIFQLSPSTERDTRRKKDKRKEKCT